MNTTNSDNSSENRGYQNDETATNRNENTQSGNYSGTESSRESIEQREDSDKWDKSGRDAGADYEGSETETEEANTNPDDHDMDRDRNENDNSWDNSRNL